jgi:hypothetical protein
MDINLELAWNFPLKINQNIFIFANVMNVFSYGTKWEARQDDLVIWPP